jgi:hypothetical protein
MMLRLITSVCLALILSLTSVTAAVAHMRAAGAVQIVICGTPGVEEVVTLDAFGDPMPMVHHCPDCLTLVAAVSPDAPQVARPMGRMVQVRAGLSGPDAHPTVTPRPTARGPPLFL